jgi:hypothetical protein
VTGKGDDKADNGAGEHRHDHADQNDRVVYKNNQSIGERQKSM